MIYDHWLFQRLQEFKDNVVLETFDDELTYSDLLVKVDLEVAKFQKNNVDFDSRVCIVGDFSADALVSMLAALKLGALIIPIAEQSIVELDYVHQICKTTHLIDVTSQAIANVKSGNACTDISNFQQNLIPGFILFSSGTTGQPKGMLLSFERMIERFTRPRPLKKSITLLMIDHFGGINTIFGILANGASFVIPKTRTVHDICESVEMFKVETLPTTPSFLNLLISSNAAEKYDLSSVERITYGTEVMPLATLERAQKVFPNAKFQQTYGLSEVGVLASKSKSDGSLWVKLGGDGFETKVIDGTLWVKSKFSIECYLNSDEEYEKDGWFNTKDQVEVDGDWLKILGRSTDLINVGGQKVYPTEVESIIIGHPDVIDCKVYAEKHALLGQLICCDVVMTDEYTDKRVKQTLLPYCRGKLVAFKVPSKYKVVQSLITQRQKKSRK
jgi:acyl-coenzyme A synthetase/AMP-(fatty) acid ligase